MVTARGRQIAPCTFWSIERPPRVNTVCSFPVHAYSLPLAVGERDALHRHFEVDGGGGGQRVRLQSQADRLGDGLRPRERLHVHRVYVEDVTRWGQTQQTHWRRGRKRGEVGERAAW